MIRAPLGWALAAATAVISLPSVRPAAWASAPQRGRELVAPPLTRLGLSSQVRKSLPNGVTVIFVEDRRASVVTFEIRIRSAGPHHDPAIAPGLAAAVQATLRESAAGSITGLVQQHGGEIRVNGREGHAAFTGSSLPAVFPALFDVAWGMVTQGGVPQGTFERLYPRARAQAGGTFRSPAPGRLAPMIFQALNGENVSSLSAHELAVRFHRERFVPVEAFIGITGDLSADDAFRAVERGFGLWRATSNDPSNAAPAGVAKARALLVPAQGAAQTRYTIGALGCARADPDYYAMEVLNEVIGREGSGRMFTRLREQKGYAYDPYSTLSTAQHRPLWAAFLTVSPETSKVALQDFLAELQNVRAELVPDLELRQRKRALMAGLPMRLEGHSGMLEAHLQLVMEDLRPGYWEEYLQQIDRVSSEDVRRVARKYLDSHQLFIVAVGDPLRLEPILLELGVPIDRDPVR